MSHAPLPLAPTASGRRRTDIDFWRGLVLCIIYINHVPGTIFERVTPKNFGFSDSAEAFVFLSGVSLALAYSGRGDRVLALAHRLGKRVAKLYGLHLFLSLAAVAIFATGAILGNDEALMEQHGRQLFVDDPWAALGGLVSLGHQLGYFNILPLYMVLMALFAVQLATVRVGVAALLVSSAAFYGLVRLFDWNVPTWPMKGSWFFDPLAWQLLVAIGMAGTLLHKAGRLPRSPLLVAASAVVVAVAAVSVTNGLGYLPGLQDWARGWADLDKTRLGLGRLVHFLALAYLLYGLDIGRRLRRWPVYRPLCLLGRHSLTVFAVLSLLAAAGQVVTDLCGHTVLLDAVLVAGGCALLYGVALLLESWPAAEVEARSEVGAAPR